MLKFKPIWKLFLVCCVIQLIAIFERQIFDFMGYMWLCIAVNFLHVVCVILGMFGALQHRSCYVSLSVTWNLIWIGWNSFIICLHLDLGSLQKEMQILNLGVTTRTSNWWLTNGPGCTPTYNFSLVDPITFKPLVIHVDKCLMEFQYVEVVQSGVQTFLSVLVIAFGGILLFLYRGKDSSYEATTKPRPGYHLSLQHSPLDNGEDYSTTKFLPSCRDSIYEPGPRTQRSNVPFSEVTAAGTVRSNKNPTDSSARRMSTRASRSAGPQNGSIYRASSHGVDNVRVSRRQQPLYQTAPTPRAVDNSGPLPPAHLPVVAPRNVVLPPMLIPGSVSPYQSRAGTEISF